MEGISKKFGNFYANKKVNLKINKGEVHTLLGENGAGKSTLMNVLIGLYQPTEGQIFLNGKPVKITDPAEAVHLGIGMVHQHFMLIEAMTVFENIILGDRNVKGVFIDEEARKKEILSLADKYGFNIELDQKISDISVGAQQRVEILKAIYHGAELLILDEPTAALTDIEVEGLFKVMKQLISEGKSIIFVSHKMREVLYISDVITVLRAGEVVGTVNIADTDAQKLANLMIGRELSDTTYEKIEQTKAEKILEFKNVSFNLSNKHACLNNLSLSVCPGEIVGVAGVDGNGQTQLAQVATGVLSPESGEVYISGQKIEHFEPKGFIEKNVANIPEDRNLQGLVGDMSISENIVLKSVDSPKFSSLKGWALNKTAIKEHASKMMEKYDIRGRSINQDVRSLSGGNQQKVIISREFEADAKLLVVAHPTRGLDIGATRFVHDQMIQAREAGAGVLLISADFDEILEMSDRIVVIFEGEIMGEYSGINPPIEEISLAMTGDTKKGGE